jgi:hypothetical protein
VFLYAFDLIELNGDDLRREPLEVRKATLASVLAKASPGLRLNESGARRRRDGVPPRLQDGAGGHRVEAEGLALPLGPLARLAQIDESGLRGGSASLFEFLAESVLLRRQRHSRTTLGAPRCAQVLLHQRGVLKAERSRLRFVPGIRCRSPDEDPICRAVLSRERLALLVFRRRPRLARKGMGTANVLMVAWLTPVERGRSACTAALRKQLHDFLPLVRS